MKIGIMQPYFMPYLGYYQLINYVDIWIAFDNIQFIDKGWVNRNRVLHTDSSKGWQYITIPLSKRGQFDLICDIEIEQKINWKEEILGKLSHYKRKAPFYNQTIELVNECINFSEDNLSKFVIESIKTTAQYLGISTPIIALSDLHLNLGVIEHSGQWALKIAEKFGASEYVNSEGGKKLFKVEEFDNKKIKLSFLKSQINPYSQCKGLFIENLSIIDYLMFNSKDQLKVTLNEFEIN